MCASSSMGSKKRRALNLETLLMTSEQALQAIEAAVEKSVSKKVALTPETDLFGEEILDSLDSMIFFLELEEATQRPFPKGDLAELGFGKVSTLLAHLTQAA